MRVPQPLGDMPNWSAAGRKAAATRRRRAAARKAVTTRKRRAASRKAAATRWAGAAAGGTVTTTGVKSEAQLQARVQALATNGGWRWHHCGAPGKCTGSGWPDLAMLRGTEMLIVELKSADGSPTTEQNEWLTAWQEVGAECHVWRPQDLPEITRRLQPDEPSEHPVVQT